MLKPINEPLISELKKVISAAEKFMAADLCANGPDDISASAETVCEALEQAVITSRNMYEHLMLSRDMTKPGLPVLPYINLSGTVSVIENNWLCIKLNTLLPHCRFQAPKYLSDTIMRLLDNYADGGGTIPYYEKAMLIIDEHCDISSRSVYDQDNKSWKAVSNALKGRLFPDDDQFSLGIALVSTLSEKSFCNIYVVDADNAGEFFNMRSGGWLYW